MKNSKKNESTQYGGKEIEKKMNVSLYLLFQESCFNDVVFGNCIPPISKTNQFINNNSLVSKSKGYIFHKVVCGLP